MSLIATPLPDHEGAEKHEPINRRMAGPVVETVTLERRNGCTVEKRRRETRDGTLHWGREHGHAPKGFRTKIRAVYGGRASRVLNPFAGGGAILLEAMRLGCRVTGDDLKLVARFILKCTLEYPQRFAGRTRPLPDPRPV